MGSREFDAAFRAEFLELLRWRRDVRDFKGAPLPTGTFERLVAVANLAPSVGLSQPWRFVLVEMTSTRQEVRRSFERCNREALQGYGGDRAKLYAQLKLAGLHEAPCQFAVFADLEASQGHRLGQNTMPATIEYSAVMAIHTLWLAARAEGVGLGWVSILDADEVAAALHVPLGWKLIGYFCLGYPTEVSTVPALEVRGWETRSETVILRR